MNDKPLLEKQCLDGKHTVLVQAYAFGQMRIQITDKERPDDYAPPGHGEIVREMCTYSVATAVRRVTELEQSPDPMALAESWARPYNCEHPGGRIRLDNTPEDRLEGSNV